MDIEIPKIGLTFSRLLMPQIKDTQAFLKKLKDEHIEYRKITVDTDSLKSTQQDFDLDKVRLMMYDTNKKPIIISNDDYILDGHHRWLSDHNSKRKTDAIRVDLPILELMRVAKKSDERVSILECVKNMSKLAIANKNYK